MAALSIRRTKKRLPAFLTLYAFSFVVLSVTAWLMFGLSDFVATEAIVAVAALVMTCVLSFQEGRALRRQRETVGARHDQRLDEPAPGTMRDLVDVLLAPIRAMDPSPEFEVVGDASGQVVELRPLNGAFAVCLRREGDEVFVSLGSLDGVLGFDLSRAEESVELRRLVSSVASGRGHVFSVRRWRKRDGATLDRVELPGGDVLRASVGISDLLRPKVRLESVPW